MRKELQLSPNQVSYMAKFLVLILTPPKGIERVLEELARQNAEQRELLDQMAESADKSF
jgi:hypothetical protein